MRLHNKEQRVGWHCRWLMAATLWALGAGCSADDAEPTRSATTDALATDSNDGVHNTDGGATADGTGSALAEAALGRFDSNHVLAIQIDLPPADWDILRKQTRTFENLLKPKCHDAPFVSPYTYQKAKVTVDGHVFVDAAVRKKGFVGSNDETKPSLKIRFDKFVPDRTFGGVKRLTLNNNKQDRAEVSQCLAYLVFNRAGVAAPRCNFAHVWVNGVDMGLFTHVEGIKKAFISRHFDNADGPLFEGTLSDFRDGWTGTFEPKNGAADKDDGIAKLTAALVLPDDQLMKAVGALIDLPHYMKFWAVESLIQHRDGYAGNRNNFYIYRDPATAKFMFIPWGADNVMRPFQQRPPNMPYAVFAASKLNRRLWDHPDGRKQYIAAMTDVLAKAWDEKHLLAEVERIKKLVSAVAKIHSFDPQKFKPGTDQMSQPLGVITAFINNRRAKVEPELQAPPAWPFPDPEKFCMELSVEATGTIATTMDTLNKGDIFKTGQGTLVGSTAEGPFGPLKAGAGAGWNKESPHRLQLQLVFQHPTVPGLFVVFALLIDGDRVVAGKPLKLRGFLTGGGGFLVNFNSQTNTSTLVGLLWEGTLTFNKVGKQPGDAIEATFATKWVPWGQ
jgi:spore coat protein H